MTNDSSLNDEGMPTQEESQERARQHATNAAPGNRPTTPPASPPRQSGYPPPWAAYPPPPPPRRKRRGCLILLLILVTILIVGIISTWSGLTGPSLAASGGRNIKETLIAGEPTAPNTIAVIDVKGIITSADALDTASTSRINAALSVAGKREDIVAVVLDMNTPGGEVIASDEIHHAVQALREAGKPVITCMRALGASGGYYIAAGTDWIVANRMTLTGSIGVIMGSINYAGLLDTVGIEPRIYKSGEMKDLLNGAVKADEKRRADEDRILNTLINDTFAEFASIVAQGRGFASTDAVRNAKFGDGRILSGEQALEYDLVDQLGYFADAVDKAGSLASAPGAKVVRLHVRVGVIDRLLGMIGGENPLADALAPAELRTLKPGNLYFLVTHAVE